MTAAADRAGLVPRIGDGVLSALDELGEFALPPGVYAIEVWGTILYPFLGYTFYGAGNYPIQNGEVTSI